MVKNIVLVHGAFADGSSWSRVIRLLQADSFHVTAVQQPLDSLESDVAITRRVVGRTGRTVPARRALVRRG
jgi:pimeloyl-ACP methyl ester carboxylesterase